MGDYKYEVAFSFLVRDEPIALELSSLLSDRLSTFVYSKKQEEIAGTDGEARFSDVFGAESRTVVVLYRKEWGTTAWTRIEQTAIRNRAYDQGYDFVLFVPLDKAPLPEWLPKTRVWLGLERWGIQQVAGVIEMRVSEGGGTVREENALQHAERLSREAAQENLRQSFLESDDGARAATDALSELFGCLQSSSKAISEKTEIIKIAFRTAKNEVLLHCGGITMTVAWTQQYSNSLKYSALYVMLWKGDYDKYHGEAAKISEDEYHFDRLSNGVVGWRSTGREERFYETKSLADHFIKNLIDRVPGLNASVE